MSEVSMVPLGFLRMVCGGRDPWGRDKTPPPPSILPEPLGTSASPTSIAVYISLSFELHDHIQGYMMIVDKLRMSETSQFMLQTYRCKGLKTLHLRADHEGQPQTFDSFLQSLHGLETLFSPKRFIQKIGEAFLGVPQDQLEGAGGAALGKHLKHIEVTSFPGFYNANTAFSPHLLGPLSQALEEGKLPALEILRICGHACAGAFTDMYQALGKNGKVSPRLMELNAGGLRPSVEEIEALADAVEARARFNCRGLSYLFVDGWWKVANQANLTTRILSVCLPTLEALHPHDRAGFGQGLVVETVVTLSKCLRGGEAGNTGVIAPYLKALHIGGVLSVNIDAGGEPDRIPSDVILPFMQALEAGALPSLQTIGFECVDLHGECLQHLGNAIEAGAWPDLKELRMNDCELDDQDLIRLMTSISTSYSSGGGGAGDEDGRVPKKKAKKMTATESTSSSHKGGRFPCFNTLFIGSNPHIGVEGIKRLAWALTDGAFGDQMEMLYLSELSIGDEGVKEILQALLSCGGKHDDQKAAGSHLRRLCLNGINMGTEGLKAIADCLAQGGIPRLTYLSMVDNPDIADVGFVHLGQVLSNHRSTVALELTTITIISTGIGLAGAESIAAAITAGACPKLEDFDMEKSEARKMISEAMRMSPIHRNPVYFDEEEEDDDHQGYPSSSDDDDEQEDDEEEEDDDDDDQA